MGYRESWLVFAWCAIAGACQGGEVPAISIGLLPDENAQTLLSRFEPMRTRLEETLQCPVKVIIPSLDRVHVYKDVVDAFVEGRIDMGVTGRPLLDKIKC